MKPRNYKRYSGHEIASTSSSSSDNWDESSEPERHQSSSPHCPIGINVIDGRTKRGSGHRPYRGGKRRGSTSDETRRRFSDNFSDRKSPDAYEQIRDGHRLDDKAKPTNPVIPGDKGTGDVPRHRISSSSDTVQPERRRSTSHAQPTSPEAAINPTKSYLLDSPQIVSVIDRELGKIGIKDKTDTANCADYVDFLNKTFPGVGESIVRDVSELSTLRKSKRELFDKFDVELKELDEKSLDNPDDEAAVELWKSLKFATPREDSVDQSTCTTQ